MVERKEHPGKIGVRSMIGGDKYLIADIKAYVAELEGEVERLTKERDTHLRSAASHFAKSCELAGRALTAEAALSTPAPQGMDTAVEGENGHVWHEKIFSSMKLKRCMNCGFIFNEDKANTPCPGPVSVGLREQAAYPHMTGAEAREAHPLARFGSEQIAGLGLYRVHWKSGGSSLAAIGMMENGDRWIAPTNWVRPGLIPSAGEWGEIERLEPIHPTDATPQPAHSITTPWGWVCSGEGDGWKETDKLVRDPELVARYRGNPNWHTIVPLYPQPAPSGVNAEMLAALDDFIQGGENCSGPVNGIHLKHLREWRRAIAAADGQEANEMGITYGDHLIDSGYHDITPEQEREIWAREECIRRGIDPDAVCADGGVEAWMVVAQQAMPSCTSNCYFPDDCDGSCTHPQPLPAAEATRTRGAEVGAIRICPMRDGPCPHGYGCPHVGDGPYGYPCKEGWRLTAPKQGGE